MTEPLDTAVAGAVLAESLTPGLLVKGYIVIAAATGFDNDGDQVTAVTILPGEMPVHECLGLIEHARIRFHANVLEAYGGME